MTHLFASLTLDTNSTNASSSTSTSNTLFSKQNIFELNYTDDDLTPAYAQLFKAITNGNLGMVKQLLDFGLDVNHIYDREQNYSFLHLACLMGHSSIVKYLLDRGAYVNSVTSDGRQPIDFIETDDLTTLSYLLCKIKSKK